MTEVIDREMQMEGDDSWVLASDVVAVPLPIVNVYLVGNENAGDRGWVLVDAGLWGTAGHIAREAAKRFGADARPAAIVLTHGHFDHVGALKELANRWDAPIYAHPMELPYLAGRSPYPPADPTVGGGFMAAVSPLYPRGPIDVDGRVLPLPADGSAPPLAGWRVMHTPGHSPGHISLFRDADGVLIAGDAFTTTKQESLVAALAKPRELHGPPAYFTPDWDAAQRSVAALAGLQPSVAGTGHGRLLRGERLQQGLTLLAHDFRTMAMPDHGRYVDQPAAFDDAGVVSVPPARGNSLPAALVGLGVASIAGVWLWRWQHGRQRNNRSTIDRVPVH